MGRASTCETKTLFRPPKKSLSIFLGLLTTIATAWLLSLRPLETMFESRKPTPLLTGLLALPAERTQVEVSVERGFGWMWVGTRREPGYGKANEGRTQLEQPWRLLNRTFPGCLENPFDRMAQTAAGWPMLSMSYTVEPGGRVSDGIATVERAHQFWSRSTPPQALPLRPLWEGFVVNTLVFIAGWWALLDGLPAARRMLRRQPGTCRKCGYRIGDAARCPECGRATSTGAV